MGMYPPRVIMTIMKQTDDNVVVPVKFEGCSHYNSLGSEDSTECLNFDVSLPGNYYYPHTYSYRYVDNSNYLSSSYSTTATCLDCMQRIVKKIVSSHV